MNTRVALLATLAFGCAASEIDLPFSGDDDAIASDGARVEDDGTPPIVGDGGFDGDTARGECPTAEDQGRILTCAALSRCEEVPFDFQLACCQCDRRYCQPEPACLPDVAVPDGGLDGAPPPDGPGPPPDAFALDVLPRLDRLCRECHAGIPNPDNPTFEFYSSPNNPPGALTPEQLAVNRAEALSHANLADPAASPLARRPTGQSHAVIIAVGDADHAALVNWIGAQ